MSDFQIQIPAEKLPDLIRNAYALSRAQGLGFLQNHKTEISDDVVEQIIKPEGRIAASMDYVNGRACKMTVFRREGQLFIDPRWYDHSTAQLKELLSRIGVSPDAVDSVREKEAAYYEQCRNDALDLLKANGGTIRLNYRDDRTNIMSGLYSLCEREQVIETYDNDNKITFTLNTPMDKT